MKTIVITKERLDKYQKEFFNKFGFPFSYKYKWTEMWADKKLYNNKSFKELLIWNGHSLWYFYEYFLRDHAPIPHKSFAEILFKIDFWEWLIKTNKNKKVIVNEVERIDAIIIKTLSKKYKTKINILNIKKEKRSITKNKLATKNLIKSRILFRNFISKFHPMDKKTKDVLIITNDRHTFKTNDQDAFFGNIIKELIKKKVSYKVIEYDRPYSVDNIKKIVEKYFLKKPDSNFIGDYYNSEIINKIFKTANEWNKKGKKIINKNEFKKSLEYRGINFYPFVKKRLDYIFEVLSYYIADVIITTNEILNKERPKIVLLEHEKNFYDKGIIINSNKLNLKNKLKIKTICFEGEVLYDRNEFLRTIKTKDMNNSKNPLWRPLPNLKLLWGGYSKKWFIQNANYPAKILKIIGAPKYDHQIKKSKKMDKKKILKRYRLKDKKTVLIVTGNIPWENKSLYESIKSLKGLNVQCIIKLHPDEGSKIKNLIYQYSSKLKIKKPTILKYVDFNELLAISDLILTYQSTIGYDILISNKPMIVLDFYGIGSYLPYTQKKIASMATNPKELKKLVYVGLKKRNISLKNRNKFLNEYLHIQDGNASKRAVKLILKNI